MSLINDALKRTKQAQQQQAPAAGGPDLKPVDPAVAKTASNSKTLLYLMVACVIIGNLLIFLYYFSHERSNKQNAAVPPKNAPATAPANPVPPAPPVAAVQPAPAPVPPPPAVAAPANVAPAKPAPAPETNMVVATVATPAAPAVPELPKPVPLKLQSIMFNAAKPAAMVSGKFVNVGDKVQGFRVTAIDQETVTLVGNGQTNVLSLP